MRRSRVLCAAVAVPVLALAAGTAAHATPNTVAGSPRMVTLTATPTGGSDVDAAPHGPSAGDQHLETGVLTDSAGRRAGSFALVGELISLSGQGQEQLSVTLHLHDGDVVTVGAIPAADDYTVPVVGGTRGYSGAGGTLTVHGSGDRTTVTLRLEH
jgi:hypothetical protein